MLSVISNPKISIKHDNTSTRWAKKYTFRLYTHDASVKGIFIHPTT